MTLRQTDPVLERNGAAIAKVKGALTVPTMQVLGPSRTWAAPILGTVGEASAEQIKASKGTLEAGDSVGQTGLQYRYDAQLRGTPGLAVHAVKRGADGSILDKRELFAEPSTDGKPLTITLDQKAQTAAEAALAQQTAHPTALVAVRVSTGEILAAAVGPAANGSTLALAGKEAPGSTFKIVSSLANVRKGATADTPLPCTPTLTVNGRQFSNYTTYPAAHLGTSRCGPRSPTRATRPSSASTRRSARTTSSPRRSRWGWARSSTCRSPASSARCRRPTTSSSTRPPSSARAASRRRR